MNIKAVAKRAGVSTATVSRTINGSAKVTPRTAARVRAAIHDLNFYPNTNARALGSGRSSLYGLIISDITNPFFPEIAKAFEDVAVEHGQEVLMANTNYDPVRMEHCVRRMLQRKVDGVAIMTSEMDDKLVRVLSGRNIPIVFLDTGQAGPGISVVRINYAGGVYSGMEHLIGLGHQRFAFISGPLNLVSALTRFRAFNEAMARNHLVTPQALIREGNHRVDGGHEAMARILASGARPTAVIASNDLTAIGAMGAIYEHGLRVPEDISVMGYDDIQLSAFTRPALTTISLPRDEIARTAFRSLYRAYSPSASKPIDGEEYLVQTSLVLRKSTGTVCS
jgi:DNA-binding LacI/PurR family transcriptional regulator